MLEKESARRVPVELDTSSQVATPTSLPGRKSVESPKVAYILSRFPKLTETFVLYELLAVEQEGIDVDLYPLWRERTKILHPEAVALLERARFQPAVSLRIIAAHIHYWTADDARN